MLNKAKIAIRIASQYYKNISASKFYISSSTEDLPVVFFNLRSVLAEPYYINLLFVFTVAGGYETVIKHNIKFLSSFDKYAKPLIKLAKVGFSKPTNSITITDSRIEPGSIYINPNYYGYVLDKNRRQDQFLFPYLMHPHHYISGEYLKASLYRKTKRTIKAYFSGNQDREAYSNPIVTNIFKKFTRHHLISILEESLNENHLGYTSNLVNTKSEKINKLIINKWTWSHSKVQSLDARIQDNSWLQTLSNSDFFLAASGITMPLCFNIIEAMSVGTIPILQHPEHLYPPLAHMENAIVFMDEKDLIEKIKLVLLMPEEEIAVLRNNVAAYYDQYLAPEAIIDNFNARSKTITEIVMNIEYPSYVAYLNK